MPEALLSTKLYIPPPRPKLVFRPRLIDRLNQGLQLGHKLTLVSAPAGFGKTTLVSEWANRKDEGGRMKDEGGKLRPARVAWLSLDEGDNDLARFLTYVVSALGTVEEGIGETVLAVLQSPQPLPTESTLATLVNEIATISEPFVLVLDDYHVVEDEAVDEALSFLLEHQPPQMHLVMATRVDPDLPLARLRARGQLTELRAADLRFTPAEAAAFLNQVMGLDLSTEHVEALENRTEGWIAGLQLAAISMRGQQDAGSFIASFTGSHRFVLDYLVEEVLGQQPERVQSFLLRTSILDRLCGDLCDAVLRDPTTSGQKTLEYLEQANLFIVPLDNERRWYRYHHLFGDLLRRRLNQVEVSAVENEVWNTAELHHRASQWYEENGQAIDAFLHAAAADDVERAERLLEGDGMPLVFRGTVKPILKWLAGLPRPVLDARPSLWVTYAMALLVTGRLAGVEEKLDAAEAALEGVELNDEARDLIGRIADTRGTLAISERRADILLAHSRRALAHLQPDSLTYRTSANWKLGVAYEFQGERGAAAEAYREAIAISQASGNNYTLILATTGLGNIQLAENQLHQAAATYQHVLELVGELPIPVGPHVHLCLARIFYEWNDLETAEWHVQESLRLAQPFKEQNDIAVAGDVFMAHLRVAQGDTSGAVVMLSKAEREARRNNFVHQISKVAEEQVVALLHQGKFDEAAELARRHDLPVSQARVHLAQGNAGEALTLVGPLRQEMAVKGWKDVWLRAGVVEAAARFAHGEADEALGLLGEMLSLTEPEGFKRIFLDEGRPMGPLLEEALKRGMATAYIRRLLAAYGAAEGTVGEAATADVDQSGLVEPLSERELEVLQLIALGLTNQNIADRLFLSLNTVKVHASNIYGKLGVISRTQAVAKARELGIIPGS